jgi:RNA recognition motif-containing protein
MSFTVFLGNLPAWVSADDIRGWLSAENLVADAIKVIRNPETQESKGFAFIEAPNAEEMNAIIRRFDRAPLEDRLLRANPAQPPKPKGAVRPAGGPGLAGPGGHGRHQGETRSHGPREHTTREGHGREAAHAGGNPHQGHEMGHAPGQDAPPHHDQGTAQAQDQRPPRRGKRAGQKKNGGSNSAFAEELAKAL